MYLKRGNISVTRSHFRLFLAIIFCAHVQKGRLNFYFRSKICCHHLVLQGDWNVSDVTIFLVIFGRLVLLRMARNGFCQLLVNTLTVGIGDNTFWSVFGDQKPIVIISGHFCAHAQKQHYFYFTIVNFLQ